MKVWSVASRNSYCAVLPCQEVDTNLPPRLSAIFCMALRYSFGLFLLDAKEDAIFRRTLERPVLGVGEDAVLVSIQL